MNIDGDILLKYFNIIKHTFPISKNGAENKYIISTLFQSILWLRVT